MNNTGNKLTQEILKKFGFIKQIIKDDDDDEIKYWINDDGITIYEDSWWLTELDNDNQILKTPISFYKENEITPEIKFLFATYIKGDGSFKSGFQIDTDQQLKNLKYSLTNNIFNEK